MESKEQADEHEDTGIWSTITSKQDEHVAEQVIGKEISRSTQKEPTASKGSEVSPFPMILSEQTSPDPKEASILPSDEAIIEHNASKTRPRTLTSKGREYQCELQKKAALANDRDLHAKLRSLEDFILVCKNPDEIRREIAFMAKEVDEVQQSFDEWIDLSLDTSESQRATNKQSHIYDTWKTIHANAVQKIKRLEDDAQSVHSRRSQRSRFSRSTKSGSSRSSYKETLLACRAKKAALQEKLTFSSVIAEQDSKLEQLKIHKELEEIAAQEAVYKSAVDEENDLDGEQQRLLPTTVHDPIDAFLNDNHETELTFTSEAAIVPTATQETFAANNVLITSLSSAPSVEPISQSGPPISLTTLPVPSIQETQRPLNPFSPVYTTAKFSSGSPSLPVIPAISTTKSEYQPTTPTGFCGNLPVFYPSPVATCSPAQNYTAQITDALAKITQLQRLPQAAPSVFKGSDSDKTKFFLWENAFDSLIDSAPVTARQKLHLLYQYLDGKAKTIVEQLQYLVEDPEESYREARKILKERFGNRAIISTDFERKLATWPKIGPNDAVSLEEFSDFLQQVKFASKHIESLKALNYPSQIQVLVEKLPGWFKAKWSDKVLKFQRKKGKDAFPSFEEFAEEVRYHAERTNIPQIQQGLGTTGSTTPRRNRPLGHQFDRTRFSNVALTSASPPLDNSEPTPLCEESQVAATQAQQPSCTTSPTSSSPNAQKTTPPDSSTYCFYHKMKSHATNDCEQFQKLSYEERKDFLMRNKICFKCVSSNKHISKDCSKNKLVCKICQQKHATILHDPTRHVKKDTTSQVNSACSQVCGGNQSARSCARIVLLEVFHKDNPSAKAPTYAVLDDQSTDVFITDSLLQQLGIEGQEVNLEINTITGVNSVRTRKVNGLHIQDIDSRHKSIKIPFAYSQEKIPASQDDIATPEIARSWKHLEGIAHHIHHCADIEIGLLIGRNIPSAFQPLHIIYGRDNEPWAEEYKFGWTVIGPVCLDKGEDSANCATVNRITIQRENPQKLFNVPTSNSSKEDSVVSFATKHYTKDITSPQQVREMMQLDYSEVHYARNNTGAERSESIEDKRFRNILTTNIHKNEKGNWEMPLPFKAVNVLYQTTVNNVSKGYFASSESSRKMTRRLDITLSSCKRSLTRTMPAPSLQKN